MKHSKVKKMTPLKAIRKKCHDCCGGSYKKIKYCPMQECPLHYYRLGHNPRRTGMGGNPEFKKKRKKRTESAVTV